MAQDVGCDLLVFKRRASLLCRRDVLGNQAFDRVAAERASARAWKRGICWLTSPFRNSGLLEPFGAAAIMR